MSTRSALITLAAVVAAVAVPDHGSEIRGQTRTAADRAYAHTFSTPDGSSATPSLAASGRSVAIVWTATTGGSTNVYLAVSSDGGTTFSPPRRVNDQDGDAGATPEQPPRVALSGSGSARVVTVVWSKRDPGPQASRRDVLRMARSTDGGRTFSPARFLHDPSFSGARGWQSLAVDREGTLHALWLDGRDAAARMAQTAQHTGTAHKGQPPQDIYHARVAGDGRTSEALVARDVCFCCKTALAVGPGRVIYAAWRHIFPGSMRDIALAASRDGGRTFAPSVRVSADNWELNGCPEDGPAMAVAESGTIHITWATVVGKGDHQQKAIFYATSVDGGKSFSARARVPTDAASTPGHPQLVLTAKGGAAIAFDEVVSGRRQVSLARVSSPGIIAPATVISGDDAASHPVIVAAGGDVLVAWTRRTRGANAAGPSQIALRRVPADF